MEVVKFIFGSIFIGIGFAIAIYLLIFFSGYILEYRKNILGIPKMREHIERVIGYHRINIVKYENDALAFRISGIVLHMGLSTDSKRVMLRREGSDRILYSYNLSMPKAMVRKDIIRAIMTEVGLDLSV